MKTLKVAGVLLAVIAAAMAVSYGVATRGERALTEEVRNSLPGSYVRTSQGTLRYDWHGQPDAPVVVLVPGFSTPSFVFRKNVPALVSAGFRVLTFDHFGRGFSDRPQARYDDNFFDQALTELLQNLQVQGPVRLVGYSMGGGVAAVFAARHPAQVSKLALIAPVGYMDPPSGMEALLQVPILGEWLFAMTGRSMLVGQFEAESRQGDYPADMVAPFAEQWDFSGHREALLSSARYFPYATLESQYRQVGAAATPTLVLWGTADQSVPFAGAARLQADVPQARLIAVSDGNHNILLNRADLVNTALIDFFR